MTVREYATPQRSTPNEKRETAAAQDDVLVVLKKVQLEQYPILAELYEGLLGAASEIDSGELAVREVSDNELGPGVFEWCQAQVAHSMGALATRGGAVRVLLDLEQRESPGDAESETLYERYLRTLEEVQHAYGVSDDEVDRLREYFVNNKQQYPDLYIP